jgi:hypothetical protein
VATSPAYGAPSKGKAERVPAVSNAPEQSTPAAAAGAVTGEENGSLDIVLVGLGLLTLGAIGAAILRARRSRSG